MKDSTVILILGPGSVGKTTTAEVLANKLDYIFIDLDASFCEEIENIGKHIQEKGYRSYCQKNSDLFKRIKSEISKNTVIALSSGFLAHDEAEDIVKENYKELDNFGIKVLLLPDADLAKATSVVVPRQLARGFNLNQEREIQRYRERHERYLKFNYDYMIYSHDKPEIIADKIYNAIYHH